MKFALKKRCLQVFFVSFAFFRGHHSAVSSRASVLIRFGLRPAIAAVFPSLEIL